MRPIKQTLVVSTHALLFFAPAASAAVGAGLLFTHVARFAFLFISAAMLVYAYPTLGRGGLAVFWRRRLLAVAVPYVTWTAVYFVLEGIPVGGVPAAFRPTGGVSASLPVTLERFGYLLAVGYYQLYYLVLLLELYVLYPAFLWLLRRTRRHHGTLLAVSAVLQLVSSGLVHWGLVPAWMIGSSATRELWNYQLFVVAGGLMAWHYDEVHDWVVRRWRLVLLASVLSTAVAEGWFFLAVGPWPGLGGRYDPSAPFQPVLLPMFASVIFAVYLLGVALEHRRVPPRVRTWIRAQADYSYGVYLSQVVFISLLAAAGWRSLDEVLPWPLVAGLAVVIVYAAATALTAGLARLPGALATAGRARRRPPVVARTPIKSVVPEAGPH